MCVCVLRLLTGQFVVQIQNRADFCSLRSSAKRRRPYMSHVLTSIVVNK